MNVGRASALALLGVAVALGGCSEAAAPLLNARMDQIVAGAAHTCGLTAEGQAFCWGRGYNGELGEGARSVRHEAVVVRSDVPFVSLSAGYFHTCGLGSDAVAYCWGWNRYGQTGTGAAEEDVLVPTAVTGDHRFQSVDAGWHHTCGVTVEGRVLCWGYNADGQLGDGSSTSRAEPGAVVGDTLFEAVSAGGAHTCAVAVDGAAFCWGRNADGQLGDGTTERRLSPTAVQAPAAFEAVTAGRTHSCGLTSAGAILCWGSNAHGELGDNRTEPPGVPGATVPQKIIRDETYAGVSAGSDYTCAVDVRGGGYCWGAGVYGQLGVRMTVDRAFPTSVASSPFDRIAAGPGTHTCGISPASVPFCWGTGDLGQLGAGSTLHTPVPLPVSLEIR